MISCRRVHFGVRLLQKVPAIHWFGKLLPLLQQAPECTSLCEVPRPRKLMVIFLGQAKLQFSHAEVVVEEQLFLRVFSADGLTRSYGIVIRDRQGSSSLDLPVFGTLPWLWRPSFSSRLIRGAVSLENRIPFAAVSS